LKKRIGILIGGKSVEHEVSIITGLQVLENIDKDKYEPIIVYIRKDGNWVIGESLHDIKNHKAKSFKDAYEVVPIANKNKLVFYPHPDKVKRSFKNFFRKPKHVEIDVLFPAMHGTNGEDGCIHGFCQMNDIPCAFGRVLSSAVGMDKVIMKKIFIADKLPIVDYIWFYKNDFFVNVEKVIANSEIIGYPLIVKPANLGSSVGISKANNQEELIHAIQVAVSYDKKIIVEKCVENLREINCAVMGYEDDLITSLCEEPLNYKDFLSYEDKYINNSKNNINGKRKIPADIDEETKNKIFELAKAAFKAIDCSGNARIDFLYDGNNIYINEINTIPGSLAFYLWEATGISFKELITRIINFAEIETKERSTNIISYNVDLINNMSKYGKCK
jgi:D-alanine-D-alanine ligase